MPAPRIVPSGEVYQCRGCRFDLSATTENRCPECGRAFNPADPNTTFDGGPGLLARMLMASPGIPFVLVFVLPAVVLTFWWARRVIVDSDNRAAVMDAVLTFWLPAFVVWTVRAVTAIGIRWRYRFHPRRPPRRLVRLTAGPVLAVATWAAVEMALPLKVWFLTQREWFDEQADKTERDRYPVYVKSKGTFVPMANGKTSRDADHVRCLLEIDGGVMLSVGLAPPSHLSDQVLQWATDRLVSMRLLAWPWRRTRDLQDMMDPNRYYEYWRPCWYVRRPAGPLPDQIEAPGEAGSPFPFSRTLVTLSGGWSLRTAPHDHSDPAVAQSLRRRLAQIAAGAKAGDDEIEFLAACVVSGAHECRYGVSPSMSAPDTGLDSAAQSDIGEPVYRNHLLPGLRACGERGRAAVVEALLTELSLPLRHPTHYPIRNSLNRQVMRACGITTLQVVEAGLRRFPGDISAKLLEHFNDDLPPKWEPPQQMLDSLCASIRVGRLQEPMRHFRSETLMVIARRANSWPSAERLLRPLLLTWDGGTAVEQAREDALAECTRWGDAAVPLLSETLWTGRDLGERWRAGLPEDSPQRGSSASDPATLQRFRADVAGLLDALALLGDARPDGP